MFCRCMMAAPIPRSWKRMMTPTKTDEMATMPKSPGVSSLARTIVTEKVTSCEATLENTVQKLPLMILFLRSVFGIRSRPPSADGYLPVVSRQGLRYLIPVEALPHALASGYPKALAKPLVPQKELYRLCQAYGVAGLYEKARPAVLDYLRHAARPCGYDREPAGHGLGDRHSE